MRELLPLFSIAHPYMKLEARMKEQVPGKLYKTLKAFARN